MRSRLDAAHGEKEKMLADKRVLESEVEREREQQALLKSQLQRVAQERQELVREIPSPVTSVNELDKTSMLQILQPYAETGDFSAQELAPVSQADDYEELDVTALGERLREHEQQQLLAEKELLLAEAAKHARTKPRFPLEADEVENGCTSAQNHVLNGKINYLQHELMLHPETVNTICRVEANAHSRKTLLEIAMFHLNSLFVTRKSRKALVELILQFRPNILSKQTTTNQESVRHIISSRLVKNDKCDPDLKVLYCQYVIAQTTSSAAARADLNKMMQEAESAHAKLLAAPDVILIDGLRCDVLLRELDDLMRVCRLLHQSYMTGDVMQLAAILKRETPLDDPEFYEVLLGPQEKTWVDDAYQRKHQRSTYRASLLAIIEPRLKQCVVGRPGKKIINNISHDIDMSDEPAQVSPVQQPALVKMKSVPVNREYIDIYESLGTHLSTILLGYGIVLSANGFNSYQLKEIELQKSLEINAAPAQQVQPVASFKQLRL